MSKVPKSRISNEKILERFAQIEARIAHLESKLDAISLKERSVSTNTSTSDPARSRADQQLSVTSDRQLSLIRSETKEMIMVAAKVISSEVHNKVMQSVAEEILPKVNASMEWYNYKTQDGDEVVNEYQRAVAREIVGGEGKQMITDGRNDKYVLSKNVQVMFNDDF